MKKFCLILLTSVIALAVVEAENSSNNENTSVAVVDFRECIATSKLGKREQKAFEQLKEKTIIALEGSEKELQEISQQLNDEDYLDTISKEAGLDLQNKFRLLSEKFTQEQNQYYQMLNQANYKFIQSTQEKVNLAAKEVALDKNIQIVLNEETCFYYNSTLNITEAVIDKMDANFEDSDL